MTKFQYDFTRIKKVFVLAFLFLFITCYYEPQGTLYINPSASLASKGGIESRRVSSGSSLRRSRRSSSGRSRSQRDNTREVQTALEERNFDLDDYFDATVYIYSISHGCRESSVIDENRNCIINCNNVQCLGECLLTNDCDILTTRGSGVFKSNSEVLTNHHVIEGAIDGTWENDGFFWEHLDSYVESYSSAERLVKEVKWYHEGDDVALIELNNDISTAFIPPYGSLSDLKPLTEVFTIGNPSPFDPFKWTASKGEITNINPENYPRGVSRGAIFYSIPIGGGNSGGGVFTLDGKLVGLIAFRFDDYGNLNGGPHIDRIIELRDTPGERTTGPNLLTRSQRQFSRSQERSYIEDLKEAFASAKALR